MYHQPAEIFDPAALGSRRASGAAGQPPVLLKLVSTNGASSACVLRDPDWSQAARSVIKARAARRRFFGDDIFSDPAWDMLLELYALEGEGRRISISKLSLAAGVPGTTALRWIDKLEAQSLVVKEDDLADGRRVWIMLSPLAASAMDSYFDEIAAHPAAA